jgi:hypothetical protein
MRVDSVTYCQECDEWQEAIIHLDAIWGDPGFDVCLGCLKKAVAILEQGQAG